MGCEFCNGSTWVVVVTDKGLYKGPCILCAAEEHRHISNEFSKLNELMGSGMHPDKFHLEVACALEALVKKTVKIKELDAGLGVTAMTCGAPSMWDQVDGDPDGAGAELEGVDQVDGGSGRRRRARGTWHIGGPRKDPDEK